MTPNSITLGIFVGLAALSSASGVSAKTAPDNNAVISAIASTIAPYPSRIGSAPSPVGYGGFAGPSFRVMPAITPVKFEQLIKICGTGRV
ncbi:MULTISPECIES: hypothetical protein [unclassified Bradyrhizobium]|uniref:hypothetical protein n=1 Tax=unclassified Bradyrhizobium TaxID=2631580 RepID=UPI001FF7E6B9|nr:MULTISPECIES: hypothetical protein [unclassified Bradyrhizobium]MCK1608156.1 hypothetical protein [Bradyrhizobium sp. 163]MCK1767193.1 hypothetical protein [Bradyrhizobium sp. 136]